MAWQRGTTEWRRTPLGASDGHTSPSTGSSGRGRLGGEGRERERERERRGLKLILLSLF